VFPECFVGGVVPASRRNEAVGRAARPKRLKTARALAGCNPAKRVARSRMVGEEEVSQINQFNALEKVRVKTRLCGSKAFFSDARTSPAPTSSSIRRSTNILETKKPQTPAANGLCLRLSADAAATRFLDSNQGGQPDNRERHTNHQQVHCEPLRYSLLRFLGHGGSSDTRYVPAEPKAV
jgi:hypothetical protein